MGLLLVAAATLSLLLISVLQVPLLASAAFPRPKISSYVSPARAQKIKQNVKSFVKKHGADIIEEIAQNLVPAPGDSSGGRSTTGSAPATSAGLYVANLQVGTPPQNFSGVLDISSQLVWMQCAPCTDCLPPPASSFQPSASSTALTLPCNNDTCQSVVPQTCTGDDSDICGYFAEYSNNYSTEGYLATDTFTFGTEAVADMVFGCSVSSTGNYSGASGVIGLGRGQLSLVSQLELSNFSYTLAPDGSAGSVQLGGVAVPPTGRSTPLYISKAQPDLYYVNLTGILVDGEELDGIPAGTFELQSNGSGGVFLSTTMPVTYLLSDAYSVVRQAFASKISAQPFNNDPLCYTVESMKGVQVPNLTLVFDGVDGGDDAVKMELGTPNYFLQFNDGDQDVECLAMLPSEGASLLGSLLQTGTMMIYDLDGEQLTFVVAQDASPSLASEAPAASLAMAVAVAVWLLCGC